MNNNETQTFQGDKSFRRIQNSNENNSSFMKRWPEKNELYSFAGDTLDDGQMRQRLISELEEIEKQQAQGRFSTFFGYNLMERRNNIYSEMKSILIARMSVELLQQLDPFTFKSRLFKWRALKQVLPNKHTVWMRYFEPNYFLSNIIYQGVKFTLKDEINHCIKNIYKSNTSIFIENGINFLAGGLAVIFAQPVKVLYNIIFYPKQFFETDINTKIELIISRLKWKSQFQRKFFVFIQNKIVFSSIYFGTFDSLAGINHIGSTYFNISIALCASALAQIIASPFESATFMFLRSANNPKQLFAPSYSYCLTQILNMYLQNPRQSIDLSSRQLYRLVFNTLLILFYESLKKKSSY